MKFLSLALLAPCAMAATLTGTVALVDQETRAPKKRDYAGVVVWLEPVGAVPQQVSSAPKQAVLDQRKQTFIPHVLAVEVGAAVDFPNSDAVDHNAFSNFDGQVFDLHLFAPQATRRVVFRRPGVVRVFCNIHENMNAVIAVLATPYFAVTGADGRFAIQAPAGNYRLRVWHERSRPDALARLEQPLKIGEPGVNLPEIRVSEEGYQGLSHRNKYGQDYTRAPEETFFYPGGHR